VCVSVRSAVLSLTRAARGGGALRRPTPTAGSALVVLLGVALAAGPGKAPGPVELVSVARDGGGVGDRYSDRPSVSSNGRWVAFRSYASNLLPGRDDPPALQVFLRDVRKGTTTLVSVAAAGTGPGNGFSDEPTISADGPARTARDVFVRDLKRGTTVLVSTNPIGTEGGDGTAGYPALSGNGKVVVFDSNAANLVFGDLNDASDVFVRRLR
jgi:hypothetical protein